MADTNTTSPKKKSGGSKKFFRETLAEMKKVTWPSKEQLTKNTLIILAFIVVTAVVISALDLGFEQLFRLFTR